MFGSESNKLNLELIKKCISSTKYEKMAALMKKLIQKGAVTTEQVCNSMLAVDRGEFVDPSIAYTDSAQDIKFGATISAPHMHAIALDFLKDYLKPGCRVLDVGSGSGYLTVAFSKMMNDQGIVVGIEHISELYKKGVENVSKSHKKLIEEGKIILKEGDGRLGYKEYAPYNCIHVGAASEEVPKDLIDQLLPGGRLVIPVGKLYQFIYLIDKDLNGIVWENAVLNVRYVPLTDKEKQLANANLNTFGI